MLVLDSGGVSRLAKRDKDTAAALILALRRRGLWPAIVPRLGGGRARRRDRRTGQHRAAPVCGAGDLAEREPDSIWASSCILPACHSTVCIPGRRRRQRYRRTPTGSGLRVAARSRRRSASTPRRARWSKCLASSPVCSSRLSPGEDRVARDRWPPQRPDPDAAGPSREVWTPTRMLSDLVGNACEPQEAAQAKHESDSAAE